MPDRDGYNTSGGGSGGGGGSGDEVGANADDICRDFLRNVCKRGKRCRFRHPDISEVTNLGVRKNEFIFCHDFQNKECVRLNCRFIHGTKEDEDCYKKTGELPPRLRQKVAAGLGLSPADLPNSKEEVPICRDFLKGDCQRGAKCKFQHLQRGLRVRGAGAGGGPGAGPGPPGRRYDPYDAIYDPDRYEEHEPVLKRRRGGWGWGWGVGEGGLHFEAYEYSFPGSRSVEYRLLEEENILLRKRVEDLKKQVNNLLATNEVLLEQNAQFRNQAKVMTLSSTPTATEQTLAPTVGTVTNYNHSIAQTHTTLSSQALQPRPVSTQDLVAPAGAPQAAPPANAAPPMNPEITPLSAALAQTIAQGMAPPVSMAPVAVSVAPVAVSMAQPLGGITMSHATTPMVTYPIASQSMRITAMPH
ncbi:LOW QUALITY PROTEIN: zinc finger CCCH domain-containing protein 10 [Melanerpes formicivorus]|uniref:LOW QUALITY PROTEIN: zinc finger CCCH domain-containing protein 10 n=1 Tax=Melanerpes formicivorus TaxID=211600 RepID=UPI00358E0DFD